MKIEITQDISGTGPYKFTIADGPERIDYDEGGECETLGEVFEKLIEFRIRNAMSYQ
jgi:hypothetical protein